MAERPVILATLVPSSSLGAVVILAAPRHPRERGDPRTAIEFNTVALQA